MDGTEASRSFSSSSFGVAASALINLSCASSAAVRGTWRVTAATSDANACVAASSSSNAVERRRDLEHEAVVRGVEAAPGPSRSCRAAAATRGARS